jgi:uncharacterized caspase-like protein
MRFSRRAALALPALFVHPAAAQERTQRMALVFGVDEYVAAPPLTNAVRDAEGVAAALDRLGWRVELVRDPRHVDMQVALHRLAARAPRLEAALFFFAGHAVEISGRNLMVGADAVIERTSHWRTRGLNVQVVLDATQAARATIAILDACRVEALSGRWPGGARSLGTRGQGRLAAAPDTLLVFSTASQTIAADRTSEAARNSPFTGAMLRHMEEPGIDAATLFARVRGEVVRETAGAQVPWEASSLTRPIRLSAREGADAPAQRPDGPARVSRPKS